MDVCRLCLEGHHERCQGTTLAPRFVERHGPLFDVQLDFVDQPVPCACPECQESQSAPSMSTRARLAS